MAVTIPVEDAMNDRCSVGNYRKHQARLRAEDRTEVFEQQIAQQEATDAIGRAQARIQELESAMVQATEIVTHGRSDQCKRARSILETALEG